MRRLLILCCSLFLLAAPAHASDLTVTVRGADGHAVPGAVVTFRIGNGAPAGSIHFDWPYRIAQQNIQFSPRLLIVPVGATVAFPNLDNVRHHVYSFSNGNRFQLQLYGHDETRSYTFNTVGVAAIGCNIHDQMSAFVIVVDTPFAAQTDANGQVVFFNVHGSGQLRVWRQDIHAPGNQVSSDLAIAGDAPQSQVVNVELRPTDAMHMH